jgi:hypothetical protein
MKKTITKLLAITMLLMLSIWSAKAQTDWNFSNTTNFPVNTAGFPAGVTTVVSGLSITPGAGIADFGVVGASAKTLGGYTFVNRFKMNGAGYTPSADADTKPATNMPTLRYLSFAVNGNSTITVDAASNTSTARNLFVTDGTNLIGKMQFTSTAAELSLNYYGPATTLYVFAGGTSSSSINLYDLRFVTAPPAITSFIVAGVTATIDQVAKTITAVLPYGTNLSSLTPAVVPASATPAGAQNFSGPVQYSVTDGTLTTNYTATFTVSSTPSSDATLSDLKVDGTTVTGFSPSITNYNMVLAYVYPGIPTVTATTTHAAATKMVQQASGLPGSATITVTAQDGVTQNNYIVNFSKTPASTACKMTSFIVNNRAAVIDTIANTVVLNLQLGTDITNLTPTVGVSSLATCTPASGVAQNFSSPVNYVVTAQDGVTQKTFAVSVVLMELRFGGPFPYETNFPVGYIMPPFMNSPTGGVSFNNPYAGTDAFLWYDNPTETAALASSVIRLNSGASIEFSLLNCDSIIAKLSATGTRNYNLYVNGTQVATTGSIVKWTVGTLAYKVNSTVPVVLSITSTETTGGNTLGYLKLTGTNVSGLQQIRLTGVTFDGETIHNANNQTLHVFDTTGRLLISSNKDINMSGNSKGVYIVNGNSGILKIVLTR